MVTLKKANRELFRRTPDETFATFQELQEHCQREKQFSNDIWQMPQTLEPHLGQDSISLNLDGEHPGQTVRSMHGVAYTRLWNADLLDVIAEYASDFQAPQKAEGGGTGLYCGEQDLFAFLIDPTGWAEIDGEAFAPGFFVWNSEVGRRSLGIQTFWFQAVCANHIVWDATEVVEFTRKHTANVSEGLNEIRSIIERLVAQRDARRDSFVTVMRNALRTRLGNDIDEVSDVLRDGKIPHSLVKEALEIAEERGAFTIFALVDALTRLSQNVRYAGDRTELDSKIGALLSMAA